MTSREEFAELQKMPQLRRLYVVAADKCANFELPALEHGGGLKWLKAEKLPLDVTKSLLLTHKHSLRELWLGVGTAGLKAFPCACGTQELRGILEGRLPVAESVVLWRRGTNHSCMYCADQKSAASSSRPSLALRVLCSECDKKSLPPGHL